MAKKPKKTLAPASQSAPVTTSDATNGTASNANESPAKPVTTSDNPVGSDPKDPARAPDRVVGNGPQACDYKAELAQLKRYVSFLHANHPNKLLDFDGWKAKTAG